MKRILRITALCLLTAGAVSAAPRLVNYQGYLTDAGGAPVPDGSYELKVRIYADSVSGTPLWQEGPTVTTGGGVFHVILGTDSPLNESLFETEPRWLGIQVGSDAEIAPRTKITSVPWALRAAVAESALAVPALPPDGDWTVAGDDMYSAVPGHVGVGTSTPLYDLHVVGSDTLGTLLIAPDDGVSGDDSRVVFAEDDDGTFSMEWRYDGLGNDLELWGRSGATEYGPHVSFDRNTGTPVFAGTGDGAITLPQDGVSALEMLNEPGVADSLYDGPLLYLTGAVQTLSSRSITCPSAGYVLVMGTAWVQWLVGSTFVTDTYFALSDQNVTRPAHSYRFTEAGGQPYGTYNDPVTLQQVFNVSSAGTYTFYFLADLEQGDIRVYDRDLTLLFIPTAYGAVSGAAAAVSTSPESAAERADAEARNTARLRREIDELRAQIEALRSAVEPDAE